MNIQNFQQQGLGPAQQLLQHQQQQKQQQQPSQQRNQAQLSFNDLFQSNTTTTNNINNNNNNNSNHGLAGSNTGSNLQSNNESINTAQLLAQTLYQGQFRSQTPQQRQPQLQPQPQSQQSQPQLQPQLQLHQSQNAQQVGLLGQMQQHQQLKQSNLRSIPLDPQTTSSDHWQDQQQLAELSRKSNVAHFYARNAAITSRKNKQFMDNSSKSPTLVEMTKHLLESDNHSQSLDNSNTQSNSALMFNKKTSHDNDDDDEIDDYTIPRIKSKKYPDQLWGALDLSGQSIPNLSPNLFKYDFLTKLYLNGNNLSHISKSIKNLKHLIVLDLSHNSLTSVPLELGLLSSLRYLYLFDNNLTTLPFEFGNLVELNFLGIEGNPNFNQEYAKLIATKGTRSLIIHLRDNAPKTSEPPKRQWIVLKDEELATEEEVANETVDDADSFTVLSSNILCHHYATSKLYSYTPSWALNWEYRKELIRNQINEFNADIICLQEVETQSFEDFWLPYMAQKGYRAIFHAKYRARRMSEKEAKKVDGCATFYRHSKFSLLEKKALEYTQIVLNSHKYKKSDDVFNRLQARDNIGLITILTHIETGENILVANTHLHWDPAFNDVKTVQVGVLLEEIETITKKLLKTNDDANMKNLPILICGDFNSQLHSAVYKLLSNGFVKEHEDMEGRDYGKFTEVGFKHNLTLKSAYDNIGELPFTNFTPSFVDVLDYIWYSPSSLSVQGLLGKIDEEYLGHYIGFPNAHFPSDHIPLLAKFQLKHNKRESQRVNAKADFRPSRKT